MVSILNYIRQLIVNVIFELFVKSVNNAYTQSQKGYKPM